MRARVVACPVCGAPLPPDTSLLGHKCAGKREHEAEHR